MSAAGASAKTKQERMLETAISVGNMQRCFYCALFCAGLAPISLILLSIGMPEGTIDQFVIPGVFFAVFSAAFACFLFYVRRIKAKTYYNLVSGVYLVFLTLSLTYFARLQYMQGSGLLFYYAAVLLGAYVVHTTLLQYAALCGLELFCLFFITVGTGGTESLAGAGIGMKALLATMAVYLLAFLISRESYQKKREILLSEQKLKSGAMEAEYDPLTGLLNRRGLERAVQSVWNECIRNQELLAAMVVDIDHFKQYNDAFGHMEGDVCIRRVTRSIAATVRGKGIAARIGGEEFFVFARGSSTEDLLDLAENIRQTIEGMQIPHAKRGKVITVSIGVDIETAGEDVSLLGLYGKADKQLYEAKQEGRNRVESNRARGKKYHKTG